MGPGGFAAPSSAASTPQAGAALPATSRVSGDWEGDPSTVRCWDSKELSLPAPASTAKSIGIGRGQ